MTIPDSLVVLPGVFAGAWLGTGILILGGVIQDGILGALDRATRRTVRRNTCPRCKLVENGPARPYDETLGEFVETSEVCALCLANRPRRIIDIDYATTTPEEIRRLLGGDEEEPADDLPALAGDTSGGVVA